MTKHLRTFKAIIMMGVLLIGIFAVLMPSSSAGIIFRRKSQATLQLMAVDPSELNKNVRPLETMNIQVQVKYIISGLWAQAARRWLQNKIPATISLSIVTEELPEWASANIEPNVISIDIKEEGSLIETATLSVSFKENVPARGRVTIKIKMKADRVDSILHVIEEKEGFGTITVTPEFLPIIDAVPRTTYAEVGPGEAAKFEIDCENLGNAMTEFVFRIVDVPDGWIASMPANAFVPSSAEGENPKKTVNLLVTPPYGFGYHNELEDITISIRGQYFASYAEQEILWTDEYYHTLTVRNRGFSTPGFEAVFAIFALVGIAFIVKKRKKTKQK